MVSNNSSLGTSTQQNASVGCDYDYTMPMWIHTAIPPYIYVIVALGIPLNLLVLLVFLLHKKPCTAAEIYLSNMAAADLFLLVLLPFWGKQIASEFIWHHGEPMCKIVTLFIAMNYNCSVYFLVLVSIDRFLALVHPLSQCKLRRRKYAKISCVVVWCLGLLLNIPTLVCRQTIELPPLAYNETHAFYDVVEYTCNLNCSPEVDLANETVQTVVAFVVPLLIIAYCTAKIIQTLKERPKEGVSNQTSERKVTVLVLLVLLAFLICWLPFRVLRSVELVMRFKVIKPTCLQGRVVNISTFILLSFGFFNSDLNPVLYVIVGKNFRKKMWEVMSGRGSLRKSSSQYTTTLTSTSLLSSAKHQPIEMTKTQ